MEEGGAPVSDNRPQASALHADARAQRGCLECMDGRAITRMARTL